MNNVNLLGRLVRDVEVTQTKSAEPITIAKYTLAVDRIFKREGEPDVDFINCVAFGKTGTFAEKYFAKGVRIGVTGRIQTGNYVNKEGRTIYTTDIIVANQFFADGKNTNLNTSNNFATASIDDDDLPF